MRSGYGVDGGFARPVSAGLVLKYSKDPWPAGMRVRDHPHPDSFEQADRRQVILASSRNETLDAQIFERVTNKGLKGFSWIARTPIRSPQGIADIQLGS